MKTSELGKSSTISSSLWALRLRILSFNDWFSLFSSSICSKKLSRRVFFSVGQKIILSLQKRYEWHRNHFYYFAPSNDQWICLELTNWPICSVTIEFCQETFSLIFWDPTANLIIFYWILLHEKPPNKKYLAIFCPFQLNDPQGGPRGPRRVGQCGLNKNLSRISGHTVPDVPKQKSALQNTEIVLK